MSIIEHRPRTVHVGGVGSPFVSAVVGCNCKNAKLIAIWYRSWPIAFTSWLLFRLDGTLYNIGESMYTKLLLC